MGEAYGLTNDPATLHDALAIDDLLKKNMPGSGVKTITVDSLTAFIAPLTQRAVIENDRGLHKNKSSAFIDKSVSMRMLQSSVGSFGTDVLWIWHKEDGKMDGKDVVRETVPKSEVDKLMRSLNLCLEIVRDREGRRGIQVTASRKSVGPIPVLWDDPENEGDLWRGMPELIEEAVYGLPYSTADEALRFAVAGGFFSDEAAAKAAYDELKALLQPKSAKEMFKAYYRRTVTGRRPKPVVMSKAA